MSPTDLPSPSVIRASEIGQWIYCQRAWWLNRQGYANQNQSHLEAGIVAHEQHARDVAKAHVTREIARYLLVLSFLLLIAVFLASRLSLL